MCHGVRRVGYIRNHKDFTLSLEKESLRHDNDFKASVYMKPEQISMN